MGFKQHNEEEKKKKKQRRNVCQFASLINFELKNIEYQPCEFEFINQGLKIGSDTLSRFLVSLLYNPFVVVRHKRI